MIEMRSAQLLDDQQLLTLMLEDTKNAHEVYRPTNYWSVYQEKFLPELFSVGLHDFRKRKKSILSSFGATDLAPSQAQVDVFRSKIFNNRVIRNIPFWSNFLYFQNSLLNAIFPTTTPYNITIETLRLLSYTFVRAYGERTGARSIDQCETSLIGNPEDVIKIGNKVYTMSVFDYYLRYAYLCNYINFNTVKTIVELGGGSGKQVELIKKLHPDTCFLLFDIPPQLYVCEQYLKAVFGDSVVSYRDTRNMDYIPENPKGKILIFGNWKFPILENVKIDLFWSSATFGEMEPEVVANYLNYVNQQAKFVFLRQAMDGKEVAKKNEVVPKIWTGS